MVPSNNGLGSVSSYCQNAIVMKAIYLSLPPCLPQHVHHLCLENRIHSLDTDTCPTLRHGEHIHNADCEIIYEFSQHQAHDFHRYSSSSMSQHLQERKGGYVDGFGVINQVC